MSATATLTICIPTFNRAPYLDLCLQRLVAELAALDGRYRQAVELFVSDNGSTDHTAWVIKKYAALPDLSLRSVTSSENRGMDYNFSRCYESVGTPYVWLLGDDDVILPGGIQAVLEVLAQHPVDILYLNNYWFKRRYTDRPLGRVPQGLSLYTDHMQFARRVHIMLTFLSAVVVRSGVGADYRAHIANSNLVQLSWVLPLLRDGQHFAVLEDWTVAAKGGNTSGYGLIRVFGSNLGTLLAQILAGDDQLARTIVNGVLVHFFPGQISNLRKGSHQFDAEKDWRGTLRALYSDNWRFYVFLWPLVVLPGPLARGYYLLLKGVRLALGPRLL